MIKVIKLKKIVFFVIIFFIIFGILYYKNLLFGNNIIKNRRNAEDNLNYMENYKADLEVIVNSNKTENSYSIHQEVKNGYIMQEVTKGNDIEGLKIELNGEDLKVTNTKLNLEKIYEDYDNLLNNAMFLNTFVTDYNNEKNTVNSYEENGEKIVEVKLNNNQNTYIKYKKLILNAKTGNPLKLEIKDNTKKETICIIYNNVEFN